MDNEDQVKALVQQSKLIFLQEVAEEYRRKQAQYDLGQEFAKTRRNRTIVVPLVILLVALAFLVWGLVLTLAIQEGGKNIKVNIAEFEDVNLKEILDAAKKNENDLRLAKDELAALEQQLAAGLQAARDAAKRGLDVLNAENLGAAEKKRRSDAIGAAEARETGRLHAEFDPKIEAARKKVAEIQGRIDAYDAGKVRQAKEQEEIRNNQQRLFNMEMDRTRTGYENRIKELEANHKGQLDSLTSYNNQLVRTMKATHDREVAALILKYNPVIGEAELKRLLEEPIDGDILRTAPPGAFRPTLEKEGVMSRSEYSGFERANRDYDRIIGALKAIPYRNSVPQIIAQAEFRNRHIDNSYERLWNRLAETVDRKNAIIQSQSEDLNQITFAMDYLISTSNENGYILDPRDPKNIAVHVSGLRRVDEGMSALVFRRDDEYIGKIRFFRKDGKFRAVLTELAAAANPLKPFDKVLIKEQ